MTKTRRLKITSCQWTHPAQKAQCPLGGREAGHRWCSAIEWHAWGRSDESTIAESGEDGGEAPANGNDEDFDYPRYL